jgi:hypothetical protein
VQTWSKLDARGISIVVHNIIGIKVVKVSGPTNLTIEQRKCFLRKTFIRKSFKKENYNKLYIVPVLANLVAPNCKLK